MYKLIIADDEEEIRCGLAEVVNWQDIGFELVGLFEDGADVIQYLETDDVDVILTDVRMAEVSGLEVAAYVYRAKPDTVVVINSGYKEFEYAQQAMQYNVRQYLLKPIKVAELREVFTGISRMLAQRNDHYRLQLEHKRYQEMLSLVPLQPNEAAPTESASSTVDLIKRAKRYITDHYCEDISLEHVADHIYLHPVYLSRMFKQITGGTFSDYLTEVRMKQAMALIREDRHKVHVIGGKVGYNSTKYFTKVFKKYAGCTPKEYCRRIKGAGAE